MITTYTGKNKPESQRDASRAHARLSGPGERANAQLKYWRFLHKVRVSPRRVGRLANAIHVLQKYEVSAGLKGLNETHVGIHSGRPKVYRSPSRSRSACV